MNKTELIEIAAEDSGLARDDAAKVIDSMLTTVTNTLTMRWGGHDPRIWQVLDRPARCSYRPPPGYRCRARDQSRDRTEVHRRRWPQGRRQPQQQLKQPARVSRRQPLGGVGSAAVRR